MRRHNPHFIRLSPAMIFPHFTLLSRIACASINDVAEHCVSIHSRIAGFHHTVIEFIDMATVDKGPKKPGNTAFVPLVKWI